MFPHGLLLTLLTPALFTASADPGVVVEINRSEYRLEVTDLATRERGPSLQVAIGSPSHPTPAGEFWPSAVIRNPSWSPGPHARALGATFTAPSSDSPLGVGKIPLGYNAIQIHGGAHPLELGKPISLGCIELQDAEWFALVRWLEQRGTLATWQPRAAGDVHTTFRRPVRVIVH
ncbi:MAG: L,D-transpeptidase [Myxococcota bacterium]